MASEKHNFIVSAITRKIKSFGFKIIYLEGKYQDVNVKKFNIPPKIMNHRPDVVGEKNNKTFCIGEAKTKNDIFSKRTKNQKKNFFTLVKSNTENKLIIGIPLGAKNDLEKLLLKLEHSNQKQIIVIHIHY